MSTQTVPMTIEKKSRKCPIHNTWIRKGICEPCRMKQEQELKQYKKERGIVDVPLKIIKL